MARRPAVRDTRGKLVDGAAKALVRHGMKAMTVEHVIRNAGLSRRTFYQYFSDKDAVVVALFERQLAGFVESVREGLVVDPDRPTSGLMAGIDAYLDFQQSGGRLTTLLQAEAANPASALWPLRERGVDALVELMEAQVRQATGRRIDPLVFRGLFLTLESLVIHIRAGGPLAPDSRARVEAVIKPLFRAALASLEHMPEAPAE